MFSDDLKKRDFFYSYLHILQSSTLRETEYQFTKTKKSTISQSLARRYSLTFPNVFVHHLAFQFVELCFSFPLLGFLVAGAASGFTVLSGAGDEALSDVFSCQLRFAEGRICKKCTSKRRDQAQQHGIASRREPVWAAR